MKTKNPNNFFFVDRREFNSYVITFILEEIYLQKRVAYNSEADIKRAEAEINKQPNKELLEHNRKRHIELKCADFEMLMENKVSLF